MPTGATANPPRTSPRRPPADTRSDLLADAATVLAEVRERAEAVGPHQELAQVEGLLRDVHTYKGLMGFLQSPASVRLANELELYLSRMWRALLVPDAAAAAVIRNAVEALAVLHRAAPDGAPGVALEAVLLALSGTPTGRPAGPMRQDDGAGRRDRGAGARPAAWPPPGEACAAAEMEALSHNLSRLLDRLEQLTADQADERTRLLILAMRRGIDRLRHHACERRYVALADVLAPFASTTAEVAAAHGKRVSLRLQVPEGDVERSLAHALRPSVVHVLRNAIAHGVEPPAERLALGKPAEGELRVAAELADAGLTIAVSDDGRGFDLAALRAAAVAAGAVSPERATATSDAEAVQLALAPGVSTTTARDSLSGNGMGMTAVAEDVARLGGTIEIETEPGKGTTVTIRVPR